MENIIEKVLKTEKNVNGIIQKAREKAFEIKQQAEKEASDEISSARLESQKIIQNSLEQAREEARQIREKQLKEAEQKSEALIAAKSKKIEPLVKEICRQIIETGFEKEKR